MLADTLPELNKEEERFVLQAAKYALMIMIPELSKAKRSGAPASYLEKLDPKIFAKDIVGWVCANGFTEDRARAIGFSAIQLYLATVFLNAYEGHNNGDIMASHFLATLSEEFYGYIPQELHPALAKMSTTLLSTAGQGKGYGNKIILDAVGIETKSNIPNLTATYYKLRKELESPEEKRARRLPREGHTPIHADVNHSQLVELVADELGISVATVLSHLKKTNIK